MVYFKWNLALPLYYYIALLSCNVNPQKKPIGTDEISEESSIISSDDVNEDDMKNIRPVKGFLHKNKSTNNGNEGSASIIISASSSISDERPVEDYVLRSGGVKNVPRSYAISCLRKVAKFCEKACKKSYRDVCYEFHCRNSVREAFRRACKRSCRTEYSVYVYYDDDITYITKGKINNTGQRIQYPN